MKTIIAGTDFTSSSVNACKYAALLAQKLNCKLTIFNLFDAPIIHSNVGLYGISYTSTRKNSLVKTNKLIKQLNKFFPKVEINMFVTNGAFKDELETFTGSHRVEAAVMGLETKNKISKFIYGSHGIDVAGKIDAPVIIVPENYKKHKLDKVLLAVDNNEKLYKASLTVFEKFIRDSKTKLQLLHVRTQDEVFDPVTTSLKINAKKLQVEVIQSEDIQDGVRKYCRQEDIDLVGLLSKKHTTFYNFFIESNTKKVAFAAKVPVMAIHE
ncbi:MAG: universal stress protein [Bacteroidota bacterium]